MLKKLFTLTITTFIIMTSLSSCGIGTITILGIVIGEREQIKEAISLDDEDHINFNYLTEFCDLMEYENNVYYLFPTKFFVADPEDYVQIGWTGQRWRYSYIYGDAMEDPTFFFIYDSNTHFIKESFDYRTESFAIDGTSETFIFSEDLIMCDELKSTYGKDTYSVIISSVNCPLLKVKFFVFEEDEKWFAYGGPMFTFELSDRLVNILKENQLIEVN